jgi:futalosine hydrolase
MAKECSLFQYNSCKNSGAGMNVNRNPEPLADMSLLITAATDFEMQAFSSAMEEVAADRLLVTGIGPVETTLSLTCRLHKLTGQLTGVVNFGIAGSYPDNPVNSPAAMLDICLAEQEVLGDLGICLKDSFERFAVSGLQVEDNFVMDQILLSQAGQALTGAGIVYRIGVFVTVNAASGTRQRGRILAREFSGLCENMEGAAVARVCQQFALPCLEVRCISNLVEDRNLEKWQLKQAVAGAGRAVAVIVKALTAGGK